MKIRTKKKGLDIKADVGVSYTKEVTSFGTGAKINCSKKYLKKDAIIIIPKKKDLVRKKDFDIKKDIDTLYNKKVTKFGNGAKIDCSKDHIGKEAMVFIL